MSAAFRQLVLKVHSLCNLACDYCYVYEAADQSWRDKPTTIDLDTVRVVGKRIAEHAKSHGLPCVRVTLHGGEPLLLGYERFARLIEELRLAVGGCTRVELGVQTNGVLLDDRIASLLVEQQVRIGVSLDGGRLANDRHRRFRHGGSSYDRVVWAVRRLTEPDVRHLFAGILATVDPDNDPVEFYHDLAGLRPGRMDLLLPHATWESPPPRALADRTVYGDWLVAVFDTWYQDHLGPEIRLFDEMIFSLLGGASLSEAIGLSAPESIVVETDGSIERTDALKVAYSGAPATGYSVLSHSFDEVLEHPAVARGLLGRAVLSQQCRACPIVAACGGGLYPHRYRAVNGFDNPSVYCHDLARLIDHVGERVRVDLFLPAGTQGP